MDPPRLLAAFDTADQYLAAHDEQIAAGGLLVRGAALPAGAPVSDCSLLVRIAGEDVAEVQAKLASVTPGLGVTVIFLAQPVPLLELARRLRAPEPTQEPVDEAAAEPTMPAAEPRPAHHGPTYPERMRTAASGDREQRMNLLRDPNKQLHAMVLKNPRIGLEEVLFAARLGTLAPEALKLIAEHAEWGQNPSVAVALVRNPKTPIPVALKLLPRLPAAELKAIAKSQGRAQLVQAARRQVSSLR